MARPTIRKYSAPSPPVAIATKLGLVALLPVATALTIGTILIFSSGVFGRGPVLLPEPGKTHIHTALLYPDGRQNRILAGAHDGLYERSGALSAPGWRRNGAVSSTDVMGLGYNPRQPNRLYVVGHSIGVAVSDDSGDNWTNLLPGAGASYNPNDVHALTVDPTDDDLYIWIEKQGLAHSTNQGRSWQPVPGSAGGQVVALLVTHQAGGQPVLYAGTTGGLLRSTDQGSNWQSVSGTWAQGGVYSLASAASRLYAGTPGGLYQSDDSGGGWLIAPGLPTQPVVGISANLLDPRQLMAMFNDTHIYESSDGGASWQGAARSSIP